MTEGCDDTSGIMVPVIDRHRCEAKAACLAVCPYGVFTIETLRADHKRSLSWRGRVKLLVHGGKQAIASRAEACQACNRCVEACPEQAISLVRVAARLGDGAAAGLAGTP